MRSSGGKSFAGFWEETLILQMTGAGSNILERICCQRNGTNRACILQNVSFKAFSFIFNFIATAVSEYTLREKKNL